MATTKSAKTTKKTTAKPKPAASTKAKSVSKASPKASAAAKTTKKPAPMQSFRLSRESRSFISTEITRQTVYWAILAIVILVVSLYIIKLQMDTLELLEEVERMVLLP